MPRELTTEEALALDEVFAYHAPDDEQIAHYGEIRAAAKQFARTIMLHVEPSADRTVALRCVREAVMNANAAIALHGLSLR